MASDLYLGQVADTPEQAERLRRKRGGTSAWRHIVAVPQAARTEQAPGSRIGLIGLPWIGVQRRDTSGNAGRALPPQSGNGVTGGADNDR